MFPPGGTVQAAEAGTCFLGLDLRCKDPAKQQIETAGGDLDYLDDPSVDRDLCPYVWDILGSKPISCPLPMAAY